MAKKYPGYNPDDTKFDEHHRSQGVMTNSEFFTSNAKGGFYEGMEWDEDKQEWVLNKVEQAKHDAWEESITCPNCGYRKTVCQGECD